MNKNKNLRYLIYIFLGIPFIILLVFWTQIPDRIPNHWNLQGEVDAYGSKWKLFALPIINILLYLLLSVLPKIDPKQNYEKFQTSYQYIILSLVFFMFSIFCFILIRSIGGALDVARMILLMVSLLFMVMGNFMGKIRRNYFVGFRTPWTMENEEVWNHTHRFAGRVWFFGSLLFLLFIPVLNYLALFGLFITYVLLACILPTVYSYRLYKKFKREASEIV